MFEFFIAKKYLIPRKKQFSVSLIAITSVFVISVVVWLLLLFLSITDGIEKTWLSKLTSLNAPLRIIPTDAYKSSYYYQIDQYSTSSSFTTKTLLEKKESKITNPYSEEEDQSLPSYFPKPDVDVQGELKDLSKLLFKSISQVQENSLIYDEFETAAVLLKLKLIRPTFDQAIASQSYLSQMCYAASFSEKSPYLHDLITPAQKEDLSHLIYLSGFSLDSSCLEIPYEIEETSSSIFKSRLANLFSDVENLTIKYRSSSFTLTPSLFDEGVNLIAYAFIHEGKIQNLFLPATSSSKCLKSKNLLRGILKKEDSELVFISNDLSYHQSATGVHATIDEDIFVTANLNLTNFSLSSGFDSFKILATGKIQNQKISLYVPWKDCSISSIKINQLFNDAPASPPAWPYFIGKRAYLPSNGGRDHPILLPKTFKENGVLVGDRGYISYGAATPNAMQEQRVQIYVCGFYDPGVLSVGSRCILMDGNLIRSISESTQSFAIDENLSSGLQIWFNDLSKTKKIQNDLNNGLEENGVGKYFKVLSFYDYDFAKDLLKQFQSDKYLFTLIGIVILVVACSNIFSFLILMINDKKKEIGVLRAMGASTKSVTFIFSICGASLGLLGCIIGAICAFYTMKNVNSLVYFLSLLQGQSLFQEAFYGSSLPTHLSGGALKFILIATPLISTIAGVIPALKASKVAPAVTLKSE
jgi:lipoprotein-releasing system permease protein